MKYRNKDIHVRYWPKGHHDSVVVGSYKRTRTYEHFPLSTKEYEKNRGKLKKNVALPDVASKNGRRSFIASHLRENPTCEFDGAEDGWSFSGKDYAVINKNYRRCKDGRQPGWSNKYRGKKKK